jgi:hypothetical protein
MTEVKKGNYNEEYIKYGFIFLVKKKLEYIECILCYEVPNKCTIHPNWTDHLPNNLSELVGMPPELLEPKWDLNKLTKPEPSSSKEGNYTQDCTEKEQKLHTGNASTSSVTRYQASTWAI